MYDAIRRFEDGSIFLLSVIAIILNSSFNLWTVLYYFIALVTFELYVISLTVGQQFYSSNK